MVRYEDESDMTTEEIKAYVVKLEQEKALRDATAIAERERREAIRKMRQLERELKVDVIVLPKQVKP